MTALYDKHRALLPPDASAVQLAFQVRIIAIVNKSFMMLRDE